MIRRRPTLLVTAIFFYKVPSRCFSLDAFCVPSAGVYKMNSFPPTFGGCRDAVSHCFSPLFRFAFSVELFLPFHVVRITLFPFDLYCVCPSHVRFPHGASYCRLRQLLYFAASRGCRQTLTQGVSMCPSEFSVGVSHVKPLILSICYCTRNSNSALNTVCFRNSRKWSAKRIL